MRQTAVLQNNFYNSSQLETIEEDGIYGELLRKEAKMAVIGLGYVGLPLALEFANDFQ